MEVSHRLKEFIDNYNKIDSFVFKILKCFIYSNEYDSEAYDRFSSMTNILNPCDNGLISYDNDKQKMKLGKLISIIVKMDYNRPLNKTDVRDVEDLVNYYKSWYKKEENKFRFVKLKGKDILKIGYNIKHYHKGNKGMLGKSCMNNKPKLLKLYSKNKKKLSLLTLQDDNDKIYARALIWKLDNPKSTILMDRVYVLQDYMSNMFYDYAKKRKWMFKGRNNDVVYYKPYNISDCEWCTIPTLDIKLKTHSVKKYPYMDTLKFKNKNKFSSVRRNWIEKVLDSTRGNIHD